MSEVGKVLKQIIGDQSTPVIICTVDTVDKEARTVDCSPISEEAPLLGVNLQANQGAGYGLCLFPEKGSYVAVATFRGNATGVVVLTEKIESAEVVIGNTSAIIDKDGIRCETANMSADINADGIIFNGGDLGGLVKVDELTNRLNIIENDINELKGIFSAWIPVPQDGGAALKTAVSSWAGSQLTPTARTDYENKKIKQ